jgi:hypothetical protein
MASSLSPPPPEMIAFNTGADSAWNSAATTQPATTTLKKNHPKI